jgi:hypothetical protein
MRNVYDFTWFHINASKSIIINQINIFFWYICYLNIISIIIILFKKYIVK